MESPYTKAIIATQTLLAALRSADAGSGGDYEVAEALLTLKEDPFIDGLKELLG